MGKKRIFHIGIGILLAGALVFASLALQETVRYGKAVNDYEELERKYVFPSIDDVNSKGGGSKDAENPMERFVDFDALCKINPEIIAWIYVPGTKIDYPVCRNSEISFYLNHDAYGKKSILGAVFVPPDTGTGLEEWHLVFYGHDTSSGLMFGNLKKYQNITFRDEHQYIYIYMPNEIRQYEIWGAGYSSSISKVYQLEFGNDEIKKSWYQEAMKGMLYQTVNNELPDQVITLSTCASRGDADERFVVHGYLIERRCE